MLKIKVRNQTGLINAGEAVCTFLDGSFCVLVSNKYIPTGHDSTECDASIFLTSGNFLPANVSAAFLFDFVHCAGERRLVCLLLPQL